MVSLECRQLTCHFSGVSALDGVSISVDTNEYIGVRGPNAAGKTTLLNGICGLVKASGSIRLYGQELCNRSVIERNKAGIIRCFEHTGVCHHLSAIDNVVLGLHKGSLKERRQLAMRWLKMVGVPYADGDVAGNLSYGQKRCLDLARAFARIQELGGGGILLLDEPFRGLDKSTSEKVLDMLRRYIRGNIPTIMVEHNAYMTESLATRLVWMDNGHVSRKISVPSSTHHFDRVLQPDPPNGCVTVELKNVRAGYGRLEVLHGINMTLRLGETVHLTGRNGSGKSTLLSVLMGSLPLISGCMTILGRNMTTPETRPAMGIGYAPQGGRLVAGLTVAEHLEMAGKVRIKRGTAPSLGPLFLKAFPEILTFNSRPARNLSAGQRSLLSMATALTSEPKTLIIDEPAAGMALPLAERLYRFLADTWTSDRRNAIIVEHNTLFGLPARRIHLERGEVVPA